ncbi:hypothetical protein [Streptomyces sp. NEAU-S7GS2]|uniref:hypothetical protein n=1 Tax=Streptomyces sp. NEAU-S7GS2 TaxID=2202000 RepID=UPI000D6FED91|nr:hypothetical protein [Streptomyces sp. NEAU-S7GS2]AWN30015.1 hypothetical protein DKG71_31045 [Streptomyces sp. NEAU-S7GS2]
MNSSPSTATMPDACSALSYPALIRLIAEIDDNGPIPLRRLAGTLADLSEYRLRRATDLARDLGLVHVQPGGRLGLTTSGSELADLYDATARWARRHAYPSTTSDFTHRIQSTLALLAAAPALTEERGLCGPTADSQLTADAHADLTGARDLLDQWLAANQAVQLGASQSAE